MKVCHITSVHPPFDARIFQKECKSLTKKYEVYLIAPNVGSSIVEGIHVEGVDLPMSRFRRQLCLHKIFAKAIEIDASIYHLHDPELMGLGLKLKKRGKLIIFDSHEDVPQQLLTKEWLPLFVRKPFSLLYSIFEKRILARYDALVSVTPSIVDRLKTINAKTYQITNYPEITVLKRDVQKTGNLICFAGGVSARYMHENVIQAAEKAHVRYILAGPAWPSYLVKLKKLTGWKNVVYKGMLDRANVIKLYEAADIGIVLLDYSPNVGYHKGTLGVLKMFEYMMAGIPVIATDFELWKDIIEQHECGICINPHNVDEIADAINYYMNNPQIAKEHGENGYHAVQKFYNWRTQEKILFEMYESLLNFYCKDCSDETLHR